MGLCTLAQARLGLGNIPAGDTSHDADIQALIDAVTGPIEEYCGPVTSVAVTEWHPAGSTVIILDQPPVISITSLTEYRANSAYTYTSIADPTSASTYTYILDPGMKGKITRVFNGGRVLPFTGMVKVVYQAGLASVPANITEAARMVVQALWRAHNGWGLSPDDPAAASMIAETLRSPQVQMLLEPNKRMPGIA